MLADETLARIPFLAHANADARRIAALRGVHASFSRGQVLWRAGERPRGLFVILSGEVRVVRARDGRQQVVHSEGVGATLGEVPLFDRGGYPATAVAATATRCAVLDRAALESILAADPRVAWELLARLAARVRVLVDRLHSRGQPVAGRLAAAILARHAAAGGEAFALARTQAELAEELGTVREVVVRELAALVRAGVLARAGRGRFRVSDPTALRTRAADEN